MDSKRKKKTGWGIRWQVENRSIYGRNGTESILDLLIEQFEHTVRIKAVV